VDVATAVTRRGIVHVNIMARHPIFTQPTHLSRIASAPSPPEMKETAMTANDQPKFDPEYVATLREVLDIAISQIAAERRTPATKAVMAQVIVQNAARGVTDAHLLVHQAVRAGADGVP
jgi:hypothetical protein